MKNSFSNNQKYGIRTTEEIKRVTESVINERQSAEFQSKMKYGEWGKTINFQIKILSLNPFLVERKIMRVGGRQEC